MSRRRDKPGIIVRKTPKCLSPVSACDAEQLMSAPVGTEYDMVPRTKRSQPQNRTYWLALKRIVDATGIQPTDRHLHSAIKRALGYTMMVRHFDGTEREELDSTSFAEMSQEEFQVYFDAAMKLIAEQLGFDPLAFLEDAA